MSGASSSHGRQATDDSEDDRPLYIKRQKKDAPSAEKKKETCDSSSDDVPLSEKVEECMARVSSGITRHQMIQQNLDIQEARFKNKTIDGGERPVPKKGLTDSQVRQQIEKRNRAASAKLRGEIPKKVSRKERNKLFWAATRKRDEKHEEERRSSSEAESSDDARHGAVPDSKKIKKRMSDKSIHGKPSNSHRISQPAVRFNPRPGGSDTLAKDQTVPGLKLRVYYLGIKGAEKAFAEGWVTWKKHDYTEANRNSFGCKFIDGTRHEKYPRYVGWSLHDPESFVEDFRKILEQAIEKEVNVTTVHAVLGKKMHVHGFVGKAIVFYFDENQEPYPDLFMRVEIIHEVEEEEVKQVEEEEVGQVEGPEGQAKKKKKGGQDKPETVNFVPEDSSDSSSGPDSNNSDYASVLSCESSSDDEEEGAEPVSDANQAAIQQHVPDAVETADSESDSDEEGFQQELPESDSDEVSDEEDRADKSDTDGSDDDDK